MRELWLDAGLRPVFFVFVFEFLRGILSSSISNGRARYSCVFRKDGELGNQFPDERNQLFFEVLDFVRSVDRLISKPVFSGHGAVSFARFDAFPQKSQLRELGWNLIRSLCQSLIERDDTLDAVTQLLLTLPLCDGGALGPSGDVSIDYLVAVRHPVLRVSMGGASIRAQASYQLNP